MRIHWFSFVRARIEHRKIFRLSAGFYSYSLYKYGFSCQRICGKVGDDFSKVGSS
jgi:hypothetical protein